MPSAETEPSSDALENDRSVSSLFSPDMVEYLYLRKVGQTVMGNNPKDILIIELKDTISEQRKTIESLRQALDAGNTRIRELTEQIKTLTEQIGYLQKKLFGTSSEKRQVCEEPDLFNEPEASMEQPVKEPSEDEISRTTEQPRTRKARTKLEDRLHGIPVDEILLELPPEERFCAVCGTALVEIGREVVRHELDYIPARVRIKRYISVHYGCPECKKDEATFLVKVPAPPALMEHSLASASSVAWVMYQKYANGLPLYRQEKDWNEYGICLNRSAMANWVIRCASEYLRPVYDRCHRKLLERSFLMADETRVQVLKEEGRRAQTDSFMWLFRSGEDGLAPIILYHYSQTRSGDTAKSFLAGFHGYLMTDAYAGYNKVPDIRRCCCYAHIRRYFVDAIPKGHENDISLPAVQGAEYCSRLFRYEESIRQKNASYEKRKELRLRYEKPVLEAFQAWLDTQEPPKKSRLDKAVQHARNRKDIMMTYLEDGRCSLSNNLSEQEMKSFVVGRKGWLFCDTPGGAEASAIVYSLVETAKANGLNIHAYLQYLLEQRPTEETPADQLDELLPWSDRVAEHCKNKTK